MKKIFSFLVLLVISSKIFSQVYPQTGSAVFNVPFFDWKDDKSRLTSDISINYTSGNGLKVDDVASTFGQGWSLSGGGVITRIQVGQPDDQKPYDPNPSDPFNTLKYPAGYLYNTRNIEDGCPLSLTKYPIFGQRNKLYATQNSVAADRELDYFTFDFNGIKGMFVLGKNNGDIGVSLQDSKMKIWYERNENAHLQGIRTTISAFYIQNTDGLIYKFSEKETTKVLRYGYVDPNNGRPITQPEFKHQGVYHESGYEDATIPRPNIINSWYLKEIKDPLTQRVITFNYDLINIDAPSGVSFSSYNTTATIYADKTYSIVSHSYSKTVTPQINSIVYPDGHQVLFGYGSYRHDLPGTKAIKYIDVKYSTRYVSKYEFNTSYFILNRIGNPVSDFQKRCARLCLKSIQHFAVDLKDYELPYTFDYYMGSNASDDFVPPLFSFAKDIWGYFNGANTKAYNGVAINLTKDFNQLTHNEIGGICFLRSGSGNQLYNTKSSYAKNGLLRQVVYPTGGVLKYEYAQNTYNIAGDTKDIAGVYVSKTSVSDGGFSNGCNNAIVTNYKFNISEGSTVSSLWGIQTPNNLTDAKSYYASERRRLKYKFPLGLKCDWDYKYPGILSRSQAISLSSHQQTMATLSAVLDVVSGISTIIDIVSVCISATPLAIVAVVIDAIMFFYDLISTCTASAPTRDDSIAVYTNYDINGMNALPSQYKRVEISQGAGSNGKTVIDYTNDSDYAIWKSTNPYLSMAQRFGFWAYGLPKKITNINASGNKVTEIATSYFFLRTTYDGFKGTSSNYGSCKCLVKKTSSQRDPDWSSPGFYDASSNYVINATSNNDLKAEFYPIYSGRAVIDSVVERVYRVGTTQFLETRKKYFYNQNNYQVSDILTVQSDGKKYVTNTKYTTDVYGGSIDVLAENNILDIPVVVTNFYVSPTAIYGGNPGDPENMYNSFSMLSPDYFAIDETVTEFAAVPNGDIRPSRILKQRFTTPKPFGIQQSGGGWLPGFQQYYGPPANMSNYSVVQSFWYNNNSDLAGVKDEGNRSILSIYGYNSKHIIANIINADPQVDKAAYTSFENTELGGWTISGTASYNTTSAISGTSSLVLSASNSLSTSLTSARGQIISFWSQNPLTLSTGSLIKSSPTVNGFTYYEYKTPTGAGSVTITGTGKIDELRSYPVNASINTVTYDPLIGKTTEMDENNRITYFSYDPLGRMQFIRDKDNNILKTYEYNVATNRGDGCNTVYYSKPASETYTKNNCSAGYEGSEVTYSIPANKYTSTVSQDAADAQVEAELITYGQSYANTNGTCIQIFGNDAQSMVFSKENCPAGQIGSAVTYTVPLNTYFSRVSKTDANNQAMAEVKANGQEYANTNGVCTTDNNPDWQWEGDPIFSCQKNGSNQNTGHQLVFLKDVNPNSPTYNQTQWIDLGINTAECPANLDASWQATGTTRCKPCPTNAAYTIGITEIQQKDMNPNSATYNQTRWIDGASTPSCASPADWQFTATAIRCKKSGTNQNTGQQEREQKDMNPCSPTYNQTQWIVVGTNTTTCPINYTPLQYNNGTSAWGTAVFTGDMGTFSYNIYPSTSGNSLGNIPSGIYNVTFNLTGASGSYRINGTLITSSPFTFNGMGVGGTSPVTINIQY